MNLIGPLASGVSGAEDGTVRIFVRGTSTLATCYSDFEGEILDQPTTGIVLDANGGKTIYVNQLVDVTVSDSTGTAVRTFVAGDSAPNMEVRSQSFTGVDYDTAIAATGNPTTAQAVFDLWKTNNGSPDWKVRLNNADVTVQAALASIYGIFYNVKDPTYGAKGDGATDDTTAIQAALTAAGAAGGGIVWFPQGSYKTTGKLTVPAKVSLWGPTGLGTSVLLYHATDSILEYGTGSNIDVYQEIRGLTLYAAQANTGYVISVTNAGNRWLAVYNCYLGGSLGTGHIINIAAPASSTHRIFLDTNAVNTWGSAAYGVFSADNGVFIEARNNRFVAGLDQWGGEFLLGRNIVATGNTFDASVVATGAVAYECINAGGTAGYGPKAQITGNLFIAGAGGTGTAMYSGYADESTTSFSEAGNSIKGTFSNGVYGTNLAASANRPRVQLITRESLTKLVNDTNTANLSLDAMNYGMIAITRTAAGAQTWNANKVGPEGSFLTVIVYWNGGGALGNVTLGTNFAAGIAVFSPASGKVNTYTFRSVYIAGSGAWLPVAPLYAIP